MHRRAVSAGKIIGVAAIAVIPLLVHVAIATSMWPPLIVAIPILELVLLAGIAAFRRPARLLWLIPVLAVLGFALARGALSRIGVAAIPGIPHALAYSSLLFVFGASLLPGHEPILTRAVTAVRGPLPPEMIVHTRRVTFAWCGFFAGQLLVSLVLFLRAPIETWSFFINVLNLPLVVAMFGMEWGYRILRFRSYPNDTFADVMRVLAKTTETGSRQAGPV
jgi:uncharacterized membrane protein